MSAPVTPGTTSRRIARNAAVRSVGDIVAKGASIVFFVAVARALGQHDFGLFTFALAVGALLSTPAGFGTDPLVAREVSREPDSIHDYLPNAIAIKVLLSVALLGAAVAVSALAGSSPERLAVLALVGAGVAIENIARSCYAALQAFERLEFVSASLIAQRIATAAVALGVLALGGGVVAVSSVYASGAALGLLLALWALRRQVVRVSWRLDRSRWLPIARRGVPIGVTAVLFTVLLTVDSILLGILRPSGDVGLYSAAFRLVEATMFVSWSLNAAMLPWFARRSDIDRSGLARGYELGLKAILGVLVPVAVAFGLLAKPIIQLFYGDEYAGSVTPLRVLAALTVLYGVGHFTGNFLIARDRPGSFARAAGIALVFNLALNAVLIPLYGPTGAAVAAVSSAAALAVVLGAGVLQVAGRMHVVRIASGPLAGGLAIAAVLALTDVPLAVSLLLGGVAYAVGFFAFEAFAWPADLALARQVVLSRRPVAGADG